MKCQSLFSGKNEKNINLLSDGSVQRLAMIKPLYDKSRNPHTSFGIAFAADLSTLSLMKTRRLEAE